MKVAEAQSLCLEQGIPFYSYRLPGEQNSYWGAQVERKVAPFLKLGKQGKGFIVVPFVESETESAWFIREDMAFQNVTTDATICESLSRKETDKKEKTELEADVSREEYEKQVDSMIAVLKQGKIHKMVLSRTITLQVEAYGYAADWFSALAGRYPDAFVFLVFIPGRLCWIGATPEVFLRQSAAGIETMALAGTRNSRIPGGWGKKEIEEQAIVTDYMAPILESVCGCVWEQKGPFSRLAGKVEHLCTVFQHKGRLTAETIDRLRQVLHPTPAVGGVPAGKALGMIRQIEGRGRRYYAGYLGPVADSGDLDWFVNLRCMELWPDRIRLYVGGGITALSDPRKEWEETTLKSRTLLDIIQIAMK